MARSQPSLDGGREPAQPPYVWNDDLAKAARFHTWDMITHNCAQHDSCNGEAWWRRVRRFYPGSFSLGENIGAGAPPAAHTGWMESPDHRAEILSASHREFGSGARKS